VNGKADGCAMLLHSSLLPLLDNNDDGGNQKNNIDFSSYTYNDWGSRVVQVATLPLRRSNKNNITLTLINTHLTFPHENKHDPTMRIHQARKLSEFVGKQQEQHSSNNNIVIVFGDFNTLTKNDEAIQILKTYLTGPQLQEEREKEKQWFSHLAHTGTLMPCDLVLTTVNTITDCHISEWSLGGTVEELIAKQFLSDHRPLYATLSIK